ncbi:glycosyltransferase family 2 protein [Zavarzinella formosa]|uniref:glycosyltransferase family 2 protein n=1 Tax=Zavarzinella formosa TaxID=360055 RepID=UPI00031EBF27|nr:glycosyltransferase family 2 protein [Zavarzinella formosa]
MSVVTALNRRHRSSTDREVLTPLVSVVIVNFCQWENTLGLARQLTESISHTTGLAELIIIDNGSPDSPVVDELAELGGCLVHRFRNNLGFARAVNEAALRTTGEWILLLNPDTSLPTGFLDSLSGLCRTISDDSPRTGVVGLGLLHADGSPQASSGPIPTFHRTLGGLFLPRRIRKCRHQTSGGERTSVDWVTGCGMLIRRDCWQNLNGFDPSFFLYYEDADFCTRAREHGWEVTHEPSLTLKHLHPLHTRPVPAPLRLMTRHALLNFAFKYWNRRHAKTLAGIVWLEAVLRGMLAGLSGKPTNAHREIRRLAADWWRDDVCAALGRVEATADTLQGVFANESPQR